MKSRKLIVISAYACETGRGGEGEIAWRLVHEIAIRNEVVVITRANLKEVHDAAFRNNPKPERLCFIYFDLPWIFRFYKKGKKFFLLYYYFWQIGVGLLARKLVKQRRVDILHHLTGGMDWMPSGLCLCRGPFIWGPVGSENTHPIMLRHQDLKSRIKEKARVGIRWVLRNLDPFTRYTARKADVVLSHTPESLPVRLAPKTRSFTQTGIFDHTNVAIPKADLSRGERLRLVYAGELKDWKGAKIALEAALRAFDMGTDAEFTIIGDGPLRAEMGAMAAAHPSFRRIRFLGKLPMAQVVQVLHESDLMLYPTFHHGLATIVLQAMMTRLPIICIEGDATGRAVGQEAGITVPLSVDEPPFVGVARAICELAKDEPRRQALAEEARRIALDRYSYKALAERIELVYQSALFAHTGRN